MYKYPKKYLLKILCEFFRIKSMCFFQSASNIFLEAIQMLQHFQETNGVLGGALFYNNK